MTELQDASAAGMIVILLGTAIGILSAVVEPSKWWERINRRFWRWPMKYTTEIDIIHNDAGELRCQAHIYKEGEWTDCFSAEDMDEVIELLKPFESCKITAINDCAF